MHAGPIEQDLVLVGGGHAHAHVLKSFGMQSMPGVRVTLVAKDIDTPYSGMLPGYIAGHYGFDDCHLDLQRIARATGVRLVRDEAVGLDPAARRVLLKGQPPLRYDALSLDIGSTPRLADVPGAAAHVTPVKPIAGLAARWRQIMERVQEPGGPRRFVSVGGGAAGVEVTLAMRHRLRGLLAGRGLDPGALSFTIVTAGGILETHNAKVQRIYARILAERGVEVLTGCPVAEVGADRLHTAGGREIAFDEVLWMTEAGTAPWLAGTGLELDARGFVLIDETLRAVGQEVVFAAGDCATSVRDPRPKAGVFAVRQGPPLAGNLRLVLAGKQPRSFRPQREFLSLISTGDRYAVASRGRLAAEGAWAWQLKDWIDRRWMEAYQRLPEMEMGAGKRGSAGASKAAEAVGGPDDAMRCGGCGAKVGADVLGRVMARLVPRPSTAVQIGLAAPDDAAIVTPPAGKLLVQTVDWFRAIVDDPWLFGRIAANHALGDIHAMGGEPMTALAIASVPHGREDIVEEDLYRMLRGGLDVLEAAGATLVGGHSAEGAELALGFTINGAIDPARILRKGGMKPGDKLILVKPLGTGAMFAADMRARAKGRWISAAIEAMQQGNGAASRILLAHGATAATDVTGFGLAGHLLEMLRASRCDARIDLAAIPALPGALEMLGAGFASTLAPQNRRAREAMDLEGGVGGVRPLAGTPRQDNGHAGKGSDPNPRLELLFDPQTAGGLLASAPAERASACLAALREHGYTDAAIIGEAVPLAGSAPRIRIRPG